jgi:hypothetical protein
MPTREPVGTKLDARERIKRYSSKWFRCIPEYASLSISEVVFDEVNYVQADF